MPDHSSLESRLVESLPKDVRARVYHVSTPPTESPPILAAPPGQCDQSTFCESHFFGIASDAPESANAVFVYAIEVLIFTTASLTTIFVSKADSSGFISKLDIPEASPSVVKTITVVFLDYLLAPRLGQSRVVLSLFARSQNQYLFPGSVENAEKHVLDDRQLIKWWCRVLDALWRPYDQSIFSQGKRNNVTAHVVVPGCDKVETRAFFPASSRGDSPVHPKWLNSYPVQFLAGDEKLPPRCSIPRLPDDPKSRFLGEMDRDYIGPDGNWRSVKSLNQFWETMSYRQECHAGRLVGFIWVCFSNGSANTGSGIPPVPINVSSRSNGLVAETLPTPAQSFTQATEQVDHALLIDAERRAVDTLDSPPPSSPLRQDDPSTVIGETSRAKADQNVVELDLRSSGPFVPNGERKFQGATDSRESFSSTQGEIVLSSESYETLLDFLLELDFAGMETAVESSSKWTKKVVELAATDTFGKLVVGRKPLSEAPSPFERITLPQVNMLTSMHKKRKPETDPPIADSVHDEPKTHVLSSNLIRKKPKVDKGA